VIIFWNNIEPGMEHNFHVLPANLVTSFGVPYDYGSIMHYSAYAFSSNGQRTIQPRDPNAEIGQHWGFSARDIERLELMYNTTDNSSYTTTETSSPTTTESSSYNTTENSSYATRSQFITLIIITLNVLTHLQ